MSEHYFEQFDSGQEGATIELEDIPDYIDWLKRDRLRLAAELAEAQRHSAWQSEKIASLQDKVDGFAGVYNELTDAKESLAKWQQIAENRRVDGRKAWDEVDRLKAQIDEMIDANKWEVPK